MTQTSFTDRAIVIEILSQLTEADPPRCGYPITFVRERPDVLRAIACELAADGSVGWRGRCLTWRVWREPLPGGGQSS
jgi:hypothetical protein